MSLLFVPLSPPATPKLLVAPPQAPGKRKAEPPLAIAKTSAPAKPARQPDAPNQQISRMYVATEKKLQSPLGSNGSNGSKPTRQPDAPIQWTSRKYITTGKKLQSLLDSNGSKPVASRAMVIGVHFQFTEPKGGSDRVVAITTASSAVGHTAVVLQIEQLDKKMVVKGLKALLGDSTTIKVVHDVHRVALWLHRYGLTNADLSNCVDLQLLYQHSVDQREQHADILRVAVGSRSTASVELARKVNSFNEKLKPRAWESSPLAPPLLKTLVQTAQLYAQCYDKFGAAAASADFDAMTRGLWYRAISQQHHSAILRHSATPQNVLPGNSAGPKAKADAPAANLTESTRAIMYIASDPGLQSLLAKNNNKPVASQATAVGVHFHFAGQSNSGAELDNGGCMVAITVASAAPSDPAVVLQLDLLNNNRVVSGLKTLLADPAIVKVMHSVHRAAFWLHQYGLRDAELV
ncbi:hypothetical protein BBJ28_00022412, partial [Nothophytophthora sp. Chile5]